MKQLAKFHIGRGGQFNNSGFRKFIGFVNEYETENHLTLLERDANGRFYNVYTDDVGREIITLKNFNNSLKDGYLMLNFDYDYDTLIYMDLDRLTDYLNIDDLLMIAGNPKKYGRYELDLERLINIFFDKVFDFGDNPDYVDLIEQEYYQIR